MAATPPVQLLSSPDTPSTPLHGARYDDTASPPTRFSSRLRQKRGREVEQSETDKAQFDQTRRSSHKRLRTTFTQSPAATPKRNSTQQIQVFSPASPGSDPFTAEHPKTQNNRLRPFLSGSTTLSAGMLPTPIKTPKKKSISKMGSTARVLFQDPNTLEDVMPSPRKSRKHKRFNGFSLENFRVDDAGARRGIHVFTDSRDQIPEADDTDENPFLEDDRQDVSAKRVSGTTKRRKIGADRPLDSQVAEAIRNDDGMVYVFRGRKVFRRFDDAGDEEEEIDPNDLGLLEHISNVGRVIEPFKTLTRKSIKPTRLFQPERQQREGDDERDEEATTDIDEADVAFDIPVKHQPSITKGVEPRPPASDVGANDNVKTTPKKRASPFDSWARLKPGSTATQRSTRSRKRAASQDLTDAAV